MEAVSWIFDANSTSFFIISDLANSVHGFVIFGLFVCRSNIMDSMLTKHRSNNRIAASSMLLGRLQDSSKRSSLNNEEVVLKFLKDQRTTN